MNCRFNGVSMHKNVGKKTPTKKTKIKATKNDDQIFKLNETQNMKVRMRVI